MSDILRWCTISLKWKWFVETEFPFYTNLNCYTKHLMSFWRTSTCNVAPDNPDIVGATPRRCAGYLKWKGSVETGNFLFKPIQIDRVNVPIKLTYPLSTLPFLRSDYEKNKLFIILLDVLTNWYVCYYIPPVISSQSDHCTLRYESPCVHTVWRPFWKLSKNFHQKRSPVNVRYFRCLSLYFG